jgi:hypothetical protein
MRWCNGGSSLSLESRTDNRGRAPAVLSRGYATSPAPPTTREYRTLARARAQHPCADDSRVRTEELELPGQMLVGELRGNWNAGPASRHCRADSTESSGMPSPSSPRRPVSAIETTTPRPGRSRRGALRLVAHCDGRGPPLRWRVVSWRTNSGASGAQTAEGSCRRSRPTIAIPGVARRETPVAAASECRQTSGRSESTETARALASPGAPSGTRTPCVAGSWSGRGSVRFGYSIGIGVREKGLGAHRGRLKGRRRCVDRTNIPWRGGSWGCVRVAGVFLIDINRRAGHARLRSRG